MPAYRIHGLTLTTDRPVGQLSGFEAPQDGDGETLSFTRRNCLGISDDSIRWYHEYKCPDTDATQLSCGRTDSRFLLRQSDAGDFACDLQGRFIECAPLADIGDEGTNDALLGTILPLVLTLRGRDGLHAAAVQVGSSAIGFMGPSGSGKSTLTAYFRKSGYPIFSDDYVALDDRASGAYALPGVPEISLRPKSFDHWFDSRDRSADSWKSIVRLDGECDSYCSEPLPLRNIFWLPPRDPNLQQQGVEIEPLGGREAFFHLMEQTYRLDIQDRRLLVRQANLFTRLIRERRVATLRIGDGLDLLPAAAETILRHCAR